MSVEVEIETHGWRPLVATPYGGYYLVEPGLIATVPHPGVTHTVESAWAQLRRLHDAVRALGERCGVAVFVDRVSHQDPAARRIWSQQLEPDLVAGLALIGKTALARAIANFFIGLSRPTVPTRLFGTSDEGFSWLRVQVQAAGRAAVYR